MVLEKFVVDAPVSLGLVSVSALVLLIDWIVPGFAASLSCGTYFDPLNVRCWLRLVSHCVSHESVQHLRGNAVNAMLVGPACEARLGSARVLRLALAAAVASAVTHSLFGRPHTRQLGASGVVFAMILCNSLAAGRQRRIPLTFVFTVLVWIGGDLVTTFQVGAANRVSYLAHLSGAAVGTLVGSYYDGGKKNKF